MGAVDWSNLHVAGAFILGVLVGGVAVARITKMVMDWLRSEDRD